jgi:hypothetical protein
MNGARYLFPGPGEPLLFGDVFSSEWLFDAVINHDAVPLAEIALSGGRGRGYAPAGGALVTNKDFLLAHGKSCRAVVLSDDCEIETCLVRKAGKSRLTFAAVSTWPDDEEAAARAATMTSFRRHPLPPDNGFEGGVAELYRLFAVSGQALLNTHGRVVRLGEEARAELEQRWAAFATRRGPLAAADNASKLSHVLDAKGDATRLAALHGGHAAPGDSAQEAGKAVARTCAQAWRVEGEIMQKIAEVHEARGAGGPEVELLESELRKLGEFAVAAANELRGHSAS